MTKDDLLASLVNEYAGRLRQSGDITISDFRKALQQKTGVLLGDKKIHRILDLEVEAGRMVSLVVLDGHRNQDVRIWRISPQRKK